MGYNSEVALTVKKEGFDTLISMVKQEDDEIKNFVRAAQVFQTNDYITLYWRWVKWHEGYTDVRFIKKFMNEVPHFFNRLGAEDDDFETSEKFEDTEDWGMRLCATIARKIEIKDAGALTALDI